MPRIRTPRVSISRLATTVVASTLVACGGSTPHAAVPTAAPAGLPPLLAEARAATGGDAWDRVEVIERAQTIDVGGLHGTATTDEDVRGGRSVSTAHLGSMDEASGFDGAHPWEVSPGGEAQTYEGEEAVRYARTDAWMTRRGWLRTSGATYRDLGAKPDAGDGGRRLRGIEATPEGGAPIELWFDDHGLLARTSHQQGRLTIVGELSDWRTVPVGDGTGATVRVAFRETSDPGDPRNAVTLVTTAAHARAALPDAAYAPPATDDRLTFANGARSTELPFELINNHIYVHATIDGQPVKLLLDTGGANLLTPAAARRLGLATEGTMAASGAGSEQVDLKYAHGASVTLGDATLAKPVFLVIDLGALEDVEGVDFDGLVGYEMFARLGVRIDYPRQRLTLTAPAAFTPPTGAIAVPFEMSDRIPIVHGSIDGVPGRFWIDTGSRVALTTMTKFTRDHDLVAKYKSRFEAVTGWGVGGAARSHPVRFHEVTVGGATLHEVLGDLFTGDKGAMADPDAAANLGGGILARFAVTFDYAHRTMYLEPGPDVDKVDHFDRSGLFFLRADGGKALDVRAVTPTGPAEAAGMKEGDRIVAIDGAAIASKTVPEWRALLRDRAPGTKVVLEVVRGGAKPVTIAITLAELVP